MDARGGASPPIPPPVAHVCSAFPLLRRAPEKPLSSSSSSIVGECPVSMFRRRPFKKRVERGGGNNCFSFAEYTNKKGI